MRNILITGVTGFLGSNMVKYITSMRESVNLFGIARTQKSKKRLDFLFGGDVDISMLYGDVCDQRFVDSILNDNDIDTVFHFGAQSIVKNAELDPYNAYRTNVMGTVSVLESARKKRVKSVIIVSSDKFYGHADIPYMEESSIPKPREVYSTTKVCTDYICQSYGRNFYVPCVSMRPCNYFGPGDMNITRLIPNTIIRLLEGETPILWDGVEGYIREFIYIEDAVEAMFNMADLLYSGKYVYYGDSFNLGSGETYKIEDLVKMIIRLIGKNVGIKYKQKEFDYKEIEKQVLDSSKLEYVLKRPINSRTRDMRTCLLNTISWYRELLNFLNTK